MMPVQQLFHSYGISYSCGISSVWNLWALLLVRCDTHPAQTCCLGAERCTFPLSALVLLQTEVVSTINIGVLDSVLVVYIRFFGMCLISQKNLTSLSQNLSILVCRLSKFFSLRKQVERHVGSFDGKHILQDISKNLLTCPSGYQCMLFNQDVAAFHSVIEQDAQKIDYKCFSVPREGLFQASITMQLLLSQQLHACCKGLGLIVGLVM